jgi:hypothetical protein
MYVSMTAKKPFDFTTPAKENPGPGTYSLDNTYIAELKRGFFTSRTDRMTEDKEARRRPGPGTYSTDKKAVLPRSPSVGYEISFFECIQLTVLILKTLLSS